MPNRGNGVLKAAKHKIPAEKELNCEGSVAASVMGQNGKCDELCTRLV